MSAHFLSNHEIEARALSHRRELGFSDSQITDFMTLITKLKRRYTNFNYTRVPNGSLGEAEAQWDSSKKVILIPENTFCDANKSISRAIFSIVHEVGHALLGHKGILNRGPIGNKAERISTRIRSMEYQARRYAAAFLVPNTAENMNLSASQIAMKYAVSISFAEQRCREFKEINI